MNHIDYFKLQAKNLFKDYKTQTSYVDDVDGETYCEYSPKYFDIDQVFLDYDVFFGRKNWNEGSLTLMRIQHIFAQMLGFGKWDDLLNASPAELELSRLLFDNQNKISLDEWGMYISNAENENNTVFDTEEKLKIFKHVFLNVEGNRSMFPDYRLNKKIKKSYASG